MGKTVIKKDMSNVYSTDEIVVGTWIDGKPLYRQIYAQKNLSTTEITFNVPATIDSMINIRGTLTTSSGCITIPGIVISYSEGNTYYGISYRAPTSSWQPNTINIVTSLNGHVTITGYMVTIEYTKTTD